MNCISSVWVSDNENISNTKLKFVFNKISLDKIIMPSTLLFYHIFLLDDKTKSVFNKFFTRVKLQPSLISSTTDALLGWRKQQIFTKKYTDKTTLPTIFLHYYISQFYAELKLIWNKIAPDNTTITSDFFLCQIYISFNKQMSVLNKTWQNKICLQQNLFE